MSSNKTPNYRLHAWEPGDHFLRSEFNENFAAIDTAIKTERTEADSTANRRLATVQNELSGTISTLRSNLESSIASLQTLAEGKSAIVTGVYTGNGENSQTISLGFTPKAVIVADKTGFGSRYGAMAFQNAPATYSGSSTWLEVVTNGFIAHHIDSSHFTLNANDRTYYYLAFA